MVFSYHVSIFCPSVKIFLIMAVTKVNDHDKKNCQKTVNTDTLNWCHNVKEIAQATVTLDFSAVVVS